MRFPLIRRLAPVALMPPAALAVHQLRYWLAYGAGAGAQLERTGHSYLHSVVPWLVLLVALAVGAFLVALGRAFAGQRSAVRYGASFLALWLTCACALVAIYAVQEFLEGLVASGHPGGLVGIFGFGGWWAIPSAACVGLVLAAIFHGARWVLDEVSERVARSIRTRRPAALRPRPPMGVFVLAPAPLAAGWSGRGPPQGR